MVIDPLLQLSPHNIAVVADVSRGIPRINYEGGIINDAWIIIGGMVLAITAQSYCLSIFCQGYGTLLEVIHAHFSSLRKYGSLLSTLTTFCIRSSMSFRRRHPRIVNIFFIRKIEHFRGFFLGSSCFPPRPYSPSSHRHSRAKHQPKGCAERSWNSPFQQSNCAGKILFSA